MIHSMTAYARKEFKGDWGTAVWEIRSVNQRYLETYIRLPEQLRSLEPVLRERFRAKLQRGKVECNLRFEAAQAAASQLHINEELAKLIIDSANWVMKEAGQGQLNPVDVLRWPGVIAAAEQDMVRAMLSESLRAVISQTLLKKIGGGRVAAHEIMLGSPAIRNLIRENKIAQMYSAIQTGQTQGMQTLDQNLLQLVKRGLVAKDEARARAQNKTDFM